jgi:hypothetical protein
MAEAGHGHDVTLGVLSGAGRTAGLGDREIAATIASAYRTTSTPATSPSPPSVLAPQSLPSPSGPPSLVGVVL